MAIEQFTDVESEEDLQEPLIQQGEAIAPTCKEVGSYESENGSIGMVQLSTLLVVCGSFSFGTCISIFSMF
ncbi:hypothetical protein SESBI_46941 [Sesbania bispinosa]|nr:hypothetical protein SESBI_46941 [Sesbania bispinosa]